MNQQSFQRDYQKSFRSPLPQAEHKLRPVTFWQAVGCAIGCVAALFTTWVFIWVMAIYLGKA